MKLLKSLAIIILAVLFITPAFAQLPPNGIPKLILYSGELIRYNGAPYPPGIYTVTFSIRLTSMVQDYGQKIMK